MIQSKRGGSKKRADYSQQHRAAERPDVIVEFLFDKGLLSICVRNIGERPAVGVTTRFSPKFTGLGGTKEITDLPLFRNIEFLGPQREITTFLDDSSSYFERNEPTRISVRVIYSDMEDHKYEATINHNLEIYRELGYVRRIGDH